MRPGVRGRLDTAVGGPRTRLYHIREKSSGQLETNAGPVPFPRNEITARHSR